MLPNDILHSKNNCASVRDEWYFYPTIFAFLNDLYTKMFKIYYLLLIYCFSFISTLFFLTYSKTCMKRSLSKRPKIGFQDQISLNAGQCEHSAIFSTFIKLPFVIKIFVLSIFEWQFYTCFTYYHAIIPHTN